ncbi:MAG: 23S rRNA (pseudouridine(1915)-N(3))-methyltransferase RlmH [Clostridia bacterium]|nr:23S rRNA (pseudouridine(1915)-N(3))-methyltransferase RlmH [Clostridia bacterium]
MTAVTVISVGTLKESYLKEAVAEYKKRLAQYAKVEEINIKEEAIKNEDNESEIQRALDAEGERILSAVPKDSYLISMCVEGKQFTSPELAKIIEGAIDSSGKITLVIGSSHGLADKVKSASALKLSISKLTFPHQLIRPVLFEAIYRSFTIIHNKRYHK